MKPVLAWVKGHLVIVICSVVIVAAPVAAYLFSSSWNAKIRENLSRSVQQMRSQLNSAKSFTYSDIKISDAEPVSYSAAPHEQLNKVFSERLGALRSQVATVVDEAAKRNQQGREPVLGGVLPEPAGSETEKQDVMLQFARQFVPTGGASANPSAYEKVLLGIRAGMPPTADEVSQIVEAARINEQERSQQQGGEAAKVDQEALKQRLVSERLAQYVRRASEISVYADLTAFPDKDGSAPNFPRREVRGVPTLGELFEWQYDLWAVQSVAEAIKRANTDAAGNPKPIFSPDPVNSSILKRIRTFSLDDRGIKEAVDDHLRPKTQEELENPKTFPPPLDVTGSMLQRIYASSPTGRWSGPGNPLYDVRYVTVNGMASLSRLPELLDAISADGSMDVIDMFIRPVDLTAELRSGFYYGDEFIVSVHLNLEVVLLREWVLPYTPSDVKKALGWPVPPPSAEEPL